MFFPAWCPDAEVLLGSEAAREHPTSVRVLRLSAEGDSAALQSFPALRAVRAWGITLNERWIDALADLPDLTELRLNQATVSASTLADLARLKGLRSLSVAFSSETSDEVLVTLGSLADLERVDVRSTAAGAGTLAALIKLPRLRELWIGATKIPGAALAKIPKLPGLELLEGGSLPWTSKALAALAMQPALRSLDLSRVKKLGGAWWSDLATRGVLERISLERTMVTSAELSTLLGGAPLREIAVEGCASIDDATIASLGALSTLTHLSIDFCDHLGDAALEGLRASTSLRSLGFVSTRFTQQGLASLASIASLREIDATLTPLEDATLRAWMEALPLERCNVALCAGLSPAGYRAARALRPSCEIHADEILVGEEKPELHADRAFAAKLHEATVNHDATVFVADYPGELQAFGAQGAPGAKRAAVSAGNHLDFARHGRWLVCDHNSGKIAVWDVLTGKAQTLPSLQGYQPRAALTPDGSRVAVVLSLELSVLDLPSGKLVFSTRLEEVPSRLLFSDDGRLLAIGTDARILVFDLAAGGACTPLAQGIEPLSFEGGSLIMSTKERAICVVDLATGQQIERWEPYVTARRACVVGSHKPSFVMQAAARSPAFKEPMITQWVRTRDGFIAVATGNGTASELITPDLVVRLEQKDSTGRLARLSGDGRWLLWPSYLGGDSMLRIWSVEALLAFARADAIVEH